MQGQRGALGSLPDTMNLPASSDSTIDPQIFWNSINNNGNTVLPDFMVSPPALGNSMNQQQQRQTLSGWNLGEPSSSVQNQSSSSSAGFTGSAFTGTGSLLGLQQYEPVANNAGVHFFPESSNSQGAAIHRDLNMNVVAENAEDDCQIVERPVGPNLNGWMSTVGGSSSDSLAEENDGRGRRLSCKRKAIEGQSSRHGESSSVWPGSNNSNGIGNGNGNGSLSISTPTTLINPNHMNMNMNLNVNLNAPLNHPVLGLGTGAASSEIPLEQRNFRVRINSSRGRQDDLALPNVMGSSSNGPHMQQLSRLLSLNGSSALPPGPMIEQRHSPVVAHASGLRRIPFSSRWNRGSSSRNGESNPNLNLNPIGPTRIVNENPIGSTRIVNESPMFSNIIHQQAANWSLSNGNLNASSGNIGSTSRAGANPGAHSSSAPAPAPNWFSHQFPRRLDLVRRSLLAASDFEQGSSSNNNVGNVRAGPSTTNLQETQSIPAAVVDQGHRVALPQSRSAALIERHLDVASGLGFPLRALSAGGEGRTRLMSEIRNVLDLMRRGEALRVEDVMILDQSSVFFRMADVHDRHRDMRVDVDNMSYEELLALEDRIGYVSTGMTEESVMNQLKKRKYFTIAMGSQMELEPCCVCQEEYCDGEDIGSLDCGHEFHAGCIKQWLMQKNLCPICKATGLNNNNTNNNNNNNTL